MHGEQRAAWFQRGGGGGPQPQKVDWVEVIAELADHDEVEIAGRKAFEDATALECHMWQVHQAIAGRAQWCLGHIGSSNLSHRAASAAVNTPMEQPGSKPRR
jgi:hypothetical protein